MKMLKAGKVLTSILVIFMLSWLTLLSSCTVTTSTPRHARSTVIIEKQVPGDVHNGNDRRAARLERRKERSEHKDKF